jgi:plastocyanin
MNWKLIVLISCVIVGIFIAPNAFADKNIQITISKGSSIKGCQYSYSCLQPDEMAASIGDTVIWTNQDNENHLIVSGSPQSGPDGWFSSNIIHPGKTFSHTFSMARPYPYFDILHPWDTGIVVVQTDKQNSNFYYEQMKFWKKMGWQ